MSDTFKNPQNFSFCGRNVDLSKLHSVNLLYGHDYEPKVILSYRLSDSADAKRIHTEIKPTFMTPAGFLARVNKLILAFQAYEIDCKKQTEQNTPAAEMSAAEILDKLIKQNERLDWLVANYAALSDRVDVVKRETKDCETRLDQLAEFRDEFHAEVKAAMQMVLAAKEMTEHNNKVVEATRRDCDKTMERSETRFNNLTDLIVSNGNDSASNLTASNNTLRRYVDDKVFGIYCAGAIAGVVILAAFFAVLHFASK
jgi:uncharacterized coiled-coil DUF342 family protein